MELLKRKSPKSRIFLIGSVLLSFWSLGQTSVIKNGKIEGKTKRDGHLVSINYKQDTIYGEYFVKSSKGVILETGFLDNRRIKYCNQNCGPVINGYSVGIFPQVYDKSKKFSDTSEMLIYDIEHSFKIGKITKYFESGKLKSQCNYVIRTEPNGDSYCESSDTCIVYFENGNISSMEIAKDNYYLSLEYYKIGILKNKIFRLYNDRKELTYGEHINYLENGKIKDSAYFQFVNGEKNGEEYYYNNDGSLNKINMYKKGLLSKIINVDKSGKLIESIPSDY